MKDLSDQDFINNVPLTITQPRWSDEWFRIAGPCAVESQEQINTTCAALVKMSIPYLRAGAFKPLTFPYRGPTCYELRDEGLQILQLAKETYDIKVVTEVTDVRNVDHVEEVADILQVGSRNMYNYGLLERLGSVSKPVLLKRHFGASLRDWFGASEYIIKNGNNKIIFCERGVSAPHTHSPTARFIADIQIIPHVKRLTNLPIIIDPSHATFDRELVPRMTYAAVAAGADGYIIEAHPTPMNAAVDPLNAVTFSCLQEIDNTSKKIKSIV